MKRRYGIYYQGILMEEYDTPAAAYNALKIKTESTGVFHELKIIEEVSHEAVKNLSVQQ